MKISELKQIIENVISNEVRKNIMEQAEDGNKNVYHIKCEGIPLATFDSEEEANEALPKYQAKHKDGELIIEKGVYESHDDMIEKFDEMNDELDEENTNQNMENEPKEGNEFSGALKAAKDAGEKTFTVDGKEYDVEECWSKQMDEEEECDECWGNKMEEETNEELKGNQDKIDANHNGEIDAQDFKILRGKESDTNEEEECDECGDSMMNETKKKRTVRITESELIKLISKMVNESVPGLQAAEKAHRESGSINKSAIDDMMSDVNKHHIDIEGSDKPEFPHPNGKGDKMARENTKEQDEETNKNFAGLQNLEYDLEPSEQFKKRLKMAIEGDTLMGNAPTTEKPSIEPSNGADKGKESESKEGNTIKTDTAKKIEKQVKDRAEDKKNRVLYNKESVPVNESKVSMSNILNEEIEKMKKMAGYNKKTQ